MNKKSYLYFTYGKITISVNSDGVILTQAGKGDAIALTPEEMAKLAKALFAVKKNTFGTTPKNKSSTGIAYPKFTPPTLTAPKELSYMEQQKAQHQKAYAPWTDEEEEALKRLHASGKKNTEMAAALGRNEGAIHSRLKKLRLT